MEIEVLLFEVNVYKILTIYFYQYCHCNNLNVEKRIFLGTQECQILMYLS